MVVGTVASVVGAVGGCLYYVERRMPVAKKRSPWGLMVSRVDMVDGDAGR